MSERVEASDSDWGGDTEALQQFRALVAAVDGGVYRLDGDDRFVAVDDDFRELIGYDRDELLGEHVSLVLSETDTDRFEERLATSDRRTEPFDLEVTVRTVAGEPIPCEVRIGPLTDDGESQEAIGVVRDVSDRLRRRRRDRELEQYRAITEAASDVIVTIDGESTIRTINPAVETVFGYEPDDLVGEPLTTLMPDELADRHREMLTRYLETGEQRLDWDYVELPGVRADGTEIPLAISFSEVEYEGERYFTGIVRDVTERKARERELQRKERRYEAIFEDPNILVGLLEPDGTVLDINRTAMEYVDAALADVTGEPFWETPWWGEGAGVRDDVKRWTERAAAGEYVEFEADLTRPNGERYTLEGFFRPVTNDDGEVVSIIVSDRDVTERRKRERALQENKNQLRALIDVLPVAVFVAEADGEIVEWNEAAEEIWGGEIAESESVDEYERYEAWWADTGDPVEPDEWPLARALRGEEVTDPDEIEIKGFDGEFRTVLNHGMPVRDENGDVTRAVVTLVDITERREYQRKLEESNERLQQFAYAASHDLQEPLRMVSSYLQLLESRYADDLDDDGEEFIEFAVDGAERMKAMIDGLLEYSRVDTRGDPLEPVDLDDVLEEVLADLQFAIEEHDAEIVSGTLPRVEGDADQLRQVFQNLLDNAIEYSGDEPPRIEITAERHGDEWTVSVADEGIGLEAEDQERIFDVFQRLHSRDEHQGTGIGLALCERIAERHGGEIWVESEPGEGATFSVTLPAVDENASAE